MSDPRTQLQQLVSQLYTGKIDRRQFMQRASAIGISASLANFFVGHAPAIAQEGEVVPPVVATPTGELPFEGQTVTVTINAAGERGAITGPFYEVREEFEAATGATLDIVEIPIEEHFPRLMEDLINQSGQYDTSIAGAWWLGDLVAGDFILPYDEYYDDTSGRFPEWNIDDVLPGPRSLLSYGDRKYMVANDHDGQVMYYRRDLFEDPEHQAAFEEEYGYELAVPTTWDQFVDAAAYFDGKDLNGDGEPDSGVTMHLKVGGQGMFHFMSFSAPFVIGPDNPNLYWFDPEDMAPLIDSPGHLAALNKLVELAQYGPEAMFGWSLGESWDYFLAGRAALTFSWGDLGALAQETPDRGGSSTVKGMTATAPIPGTMMYHNVTTGEDVEVDSPNVVGNTTGGSWSGVISRFSEAPEATYFLLALVASKPKSIVYAQRGWDGVDPGRTFHFPEPNGTASIEGYVEAGWDEQDAIDYTAAFFENFNAEQQFPYLRIPGTFEYWTALDIRLSEAITEQSSPEDALAGAASDFEEITDRLGRDQLASLGALDHTPLTVRRRSVSAETAATTQTVARRWKPRGRRQDAVKWAFILPAVIWVLAFTLYPLGYAIYTSLHSYRYGVINQFVGLDNFRRLFRDDVLRQDLVTTLIIVVIAVAFQMLLGVGLAVLFNREIHGKSIFRTITTLPLFATPIAVGYLGITLFYEEGGPVNSLLQTFGAPQIAWLSSPNGARAAVILTDIWQWTPFVFLIVLAGLQSLPQDVIEAAEVDGSSPMQVFMNITLPLVAPTLWLVLLLRVIDAFKIFDIVAAMTLGGPGRATEVYSRYVYLTARRFTNYGEAAAQGFLLLFIVMVFVTLLWGRIRHLYEDTGR